jgi:hypothetical protein
MRTHVNFMDRPAVQRRLQIWAWSSFWCVRLAGLGCTRAGVTVLVRSSLLASGALQVQGEVHAAVDGPAQGRLLCVPLVWTAVAVCAFGVDSYCCVCLWCGQRLHAVGIYMRASDHAANAANISGPLLELYQQHERQPSTGLVLPGD